MKFKSSLVAIASASALAGAAILALPNPAQANPCIFGKLKALDSNKIAILGGGMLGLTGLIGGGMAIKSRFDRKARPELLAKNSFTSSHFPIIVPPEALSSSNATEMPSESKTTLR